MDRNEVGSLLVTAGLGAPNEHALISLLAINGLRISEALGANIRRTRPRARHRTLTVLRKGGKIVTIPLAPRTARAIDLAIGERFNGPIFLRTDGHRMDHHCASRIVRRVARRAGVDEPIGPHTLRHAFITAALDAGVPLRDAQEAASHADPRTTMRTTEPASPSTGTPPTSSPPTSPAPHANPNVAGRHSPAAPHSARRPRYRVRSRSNPGAQMERSDPARRGRREGKVTAELHPIGASAQVSSSASTTSALACAFDPGWNYVQVLDDRRYESCQLIGLVLGYRLKFVRMRSRIAE